MTAKESDVLNFLKGSPETWYNRREIAKKAGGRKLFEEDNHWCAPALAALVDQELIEQNDSGHYKYHKPY
jgi:hypothetical protein